METRSNHILVGAVVLGMLAALVLFVVWLSQAGGDQDKKYDIFFSQAVEGLAKGSAVTFSGVPVGQVESINLMPRHAAIRPDPDHRSARRPRSSSEPPRR